MRSKALSSFKIRFDENGRIEGLQRTAFGLTFVHEGMSQDKYEDFINRGKK